MTRREEILALLRLKQQAINLIQRSADEQILRHNKDITSLYLELREIDYADHFKEMEADYAEAH